MPVFTADQLRRVGCTIFQATSAPDRIARQVSDSLVENNLVGYDSHGVIWIPTYVHWIQNGQIDPKAEAELIVETATSALIDGHWGFGQVVARRAMQVVIDKAKKNDVSAVGIRQCNHVGRLGEYAMMAAEQGLIGLVACNSGPPGGTVAPYGGTGRVLATNPVAFSVPAGEMPPLLADFATSAVAGSRCKVAMDRGETIPEGWILDKHGQPTSDPADYFRGGVLLPFGGHKGYALCLLMEILGGALTGAGCSPLPEYEGGNGVLMMAIDAGSFKPLGEFKATIDRLFTVVKETTTAPGFKEVLIPGEPECRARVNREKEGILVADRTWQDIIKVAKELGAVLVI